jgi:hypothetical protein
LRVKERRGCPRARLWIDRIAPVALGVKGSGRCPRAGPWSERGARLRREGGVGAEIAVTEISVLDKG